MTSNILPIKIWGKGGPNPPRVAIILEELDLRHEFQPITLADVKTPEYLAVNPNGRLPVRPKHKPHAMGIWRHCRILSGALRHIA